MAGIDINRTTDGVYLPPAVSSEIWADAQEQSIVMQLARQITLPASGMTVPMITGDPEAEWVAETDPKPVSRGTFDHRTLTPYKVAVIEPFSMEFRRDLPALYNAVRSRLANAIARKFDEAVLFGPAPGTGFDTLADAPEVALVNTGDTTMYDGLVEAISTVSDGDGDLSAWVFNGGGEAMALQAKDQNGRPLFIQDLQNEGRRIGRFLGRDAYKSKHVRRDDNTIGFAGDWSTAMYGVVAQISVTESDQATLTDGDTTLNLWQRNMFALRCEAELGFAVRDSDRFVRLTDGGS
ncbi:phage major capsid protein [Nocardiopsis alba]|uniref:phage major capsid protein n=1 Tax=Nocardiopsis alba TaxID=53437 RepID=UPI003D7511BA